MTTVKIPPTDAVEPDEFDSWRIVRVGEVAPKKGDHGSWVETDHPAVVACMGSVPACAANGCQLHWRSMETAPKNNLESILIVVNAQQGPPWVTVGEAYWTRAGWHWAETGMRSGLVNRTPDGWMPLPDPPVGGADGGRESPA